jgi:hypothetical protein
MGIFRKKPSAGAIAETPVFHSPDKRRISRSIRSRQACTSLDQPKFTSVIFRIIREALDTKIFFLSYLRPLLTTPYLILGLPRPASPNRSLGNQAKPGETVPGFDTGRAPEYIENGDMNRYSRQITWQLPGSGPAILLLFFLAVALPPVFLFLPLLFFVSILLLFKPREPDTAPVFSLRSPGLNPRGPPF